MEKKDEARYQVYCHTNLVNGKLYFGVTRNTWESRWKTKYRQNLHFYRAIQKYGEENWKHEVVADGLTRKSAAAYEQAMIDFFDTTDRTKGYNIGRGGEGLDGYASLRAVQESREYKEALGAAMKRVWDNLPEEEKARRNKLRGEASRKAWQDEDYRRRVTEASRRIQREKWEAIRATPEYQLKRAGSVFRAKQRRKEYSKEHYSYTPVDPAIKFQHQSEAQKKSWENNEERRQRLSDATKERLSDPAVREAIRQRMVGTELTEERISNITKGMKEKWQDPDFRASQMKKHKPRTEEQKQSARESAKGRKILCVETGVIYPSAAEAARAMGHTPKQFQKARRQQETVYGYHWQFVEEEKDNCRRVECIETGAQYDSIVEAEEKTGVCKSSICGCCNGRRKTAGGYHWKYV